MHKFYIHYLLGFNLIKSKYKKIKNKVKILARLRKSKIIIFLVFTKIVLLKNPLF